MVYQYKSIYVGGNMEVRAPLAIADTIESSFQYVKDSSVDQSVKDVLDKLGVAIVDVARQIEPPVAGDLSSDFQTLTREVAAQRPKRYEFALECLRETAATLGAVGVPVVDLATKLKELVGL